MNELKSKLRTIVNEYQGFPAIEVIRSEILSRINTQLEFESINTHLFVELEEDNGCFTGNLLLLPISESIVKSIKNVRVI